MAFPDAYRFPAFLLTLLLIATIDGYRRGAGARTWRDYAAPLLGGVLGAAFGLLNDSLVTARLSPDYFKLGKGVPGGDGFAQRVAWLGLEAGAGAGLLVGAAYFYVNTRGRERPSLPGSRLVLQFWKPLALAVAFGILLPFCFASRDPLGFRPVLHPVLSSEAVRRFLLVWWIHLGLYVGLLAGLAWGALTIHRERIRA